MIILSSEPSWAARSAATLMDAGYHVAVVNSAEAAMEIARSLEASAFVLDSHSASRSEIEYADLPSGTRVPLVVLDEEERTDSDSREPSRVERERLIKLVGKATADLVSA